MVSPDPNCILNPPPGKPTLSIQIRLLASSSSETTDRMLVHQPYCVCDFRHTQCKTATLPPERAAGAPTWASLFCIPQPSIGFSRSSDRWHLHM